MRYKFTTHDIYLNFLLRSVVRNLPKDDSAPGVIGPDLHPLHIHLHVWKFSEYLSHQLYVIRQLLDLVEICDDANWQELVRVHLGHQVGVVGEVLPGEVVLQLVGQHLLQLVHGQPRSTWLSCLSLGGSCLRRLAGQLLGHRTAGG